MASLDIFRSNSLNLEKQNYENKTYENILWPIKNLEKYFMAHQYIPKYFMPPEKPSDPPPTYLMYCP